MSHHSDMCEAHPPRGACSVNFSDRRRHKKILPLGSDQSSSCESENPGSHNLQISEADPEVPGGESWQGWGGGGDISLVQCSGGTTGNQMTACL